MIWKERNRVREWNKSTKVREKNSLISTACVIHFLPWCFVGDHDFKQYTTWQNWVLFRKPPFSYFSVSPVVFILMVSVGTEKTHNEQIKEMRDEKVHKEGQTKKYQGEKKEKKKALMWQSWPGILMRSHSDSGMQVRSSHCGCQITSTPQQEIWDRMWGERGRIINPHPLGRQREQR